jgi:hypothetical protein
MRRRPSSATSPFFFSRSQPEDIDLSSFGRGQALQRIALYPVRVRTPFSHNYSRGAGRDVVGISRGAVSEQLMVSDQAARSIG